MSSEKEPEKFIEILRLTPEAYRQLEQQCPAPVLTNNPDSAAYNLGIQFVLDKLRRGFVTQ